MTLYQLYHNNFTWTDHLLEKIVYHCPWWLAPDLECKESLKVSFRVPYLKAQRLFFPRTPENVILLHFWGSLLAGCMLFYNASVIFCLGLSQIFWHLVSHSLMHSLRATPTVHSLAPQMLPHHGFPFETRWVLTCSLIFFFNFLVDIASFLAADVNSLWQSCFRLLHWVWIVCHSSLVPAAGTQTSISIFDIFFCSK